MTTHIRFPVLTALCILIAASRGLAAKAVAPLPPEVRAVWEMSKAHRDTTLTRERVCLNGLWRWQPAKPDSGAVPAGAWGHFKVPGAWPGITDYMQKDCQTVHPHPDWKAEKLGAISAAWHQREFEVPAEWAGRRITLQLEYLNSFAAVYVDGRKAGEARFPGGELDITAACRPGNKHVLSLLVIAMPLKGVMLSHSDSASAREIKGTVARRGLCGDVWLVGTPSARVVDAKVDTSVRRSEITFSAKLDGLANDGQYTLRAQIMDGGREVGQFTSKAFTNAELADGRTAFAAQWKPQKLWDTHTPGNQYDLHLSLLDTAGKVVDAAWPVRFGFREFWIDGRDFYLNGTRIFLSAVPLDNAQVGAAWANYAGARESLLRLKEIGINFVYTHNYGCEPGAHLSFTEVLRAADDVGMLVALSQPHFSHYDWKAPDADRTNGYARHAEFYVRVAQEHPSVIAYAMSHNATGYSEDMNPDMMDGIQAPRDTWALNNAKLALRAEAIVKGFDSGRIVYHHASGNLGSMHLSNFYANFVPIQEMSDWFGHWSTHGTKPLFTCEYAVPFTWDWTMYRGWYKGQREFGSAKVPWEFCLAEWNAQFLGHRAFQISEAEKTNLRWEARQFQAGATWHRWDYPNQVGSTRFDERYPVFAAYITDNWRAFRTWGLSAISPWEHGHYWKLRDGVNRARQELPTDWDNLQRPGLSPDYLDQRYERVDLAFERTDWIETPASQALLRNNRPLLAYIAGKPNAFTSKDHNFIPGETVEKQIIVINNSRETVTCNISWSVDAVADATGSREVTVAAGQQERIPVRFRAPDVHPGPMLHARFGFSTGEVQEDSFPLHILPRPTAVQQVSKIALFDPKGETAALLKGIGMTFQPVDATSDLAGFDTLIVGKAALTIDGAAPDISRVRDGLKVILFEQTSNVLEKRFGFRTAEYGLRTVFPRVAGHPLLDAIAEENLRDWRGDATILPPRLKYEMRPRYGPTVQWCGIPVTRAWRCGNRGNVASVLIEKPARGDFLPILDGGFGLQYSPLMEYREGKGILLFCQIDVTGRTEADPAADRLARNIVQYIAQWKPPVRRTALYAGDPAGKTHLEAAGIITTPYTGGPLRPDQVLIAGPSSGPVLAPHAPAIAGWINDGGHLLAIGLDQADAGALPVKVTLRKAEHIAAYFEPFPPGSPLAGISPADVHNRDPRDLPLITAGATAAGNGILAHAVDGRVVFCQIVPWQFDPTKQSNLKRTHRRAAVLLTRLLANMGVESSTPTLARFHTPVDPARSETRWLTGHYLDQPEEWDDPYRFFRW